MLVGAALVSAGASLLAGCATTPLAGPGAVIRYRQIGACNGTAGVNAGPQAAFVLFQIDSIRNDSGVTFNFDPTKLFVTGPTRESISTVSPVLGVVNAAPASSTPVPPNGQQTDFPPAAFGVVTVATTAGNGAVEANKTRFFLNYDAGPNDPPIFGEALDLARTVWPYTPDCADLRPTLGQSAYRDTGGQISTFRIDPATGALTDLGKPVPDTLVPGDTNQGILADPRGHFLFAMDATVQEVLTYKIQADGSLAPANQSGAATGYNPTRIVTDPAGRFLYVKTNDGIDAFRVDAATGNLSKAGHIAMIGVGSFAVDGSGSFLYVLSDAGMLAVFVINQSSGGLSPVKNLAPVGGFEFMAVSPLSGYLYLIDPISKTVRGFQFDPTKPALTELPVAAPLAITYEYATMTFDPSGGFLYITNDQYGVEAFSVSATGALEPLATPTGLNPSSIVAEPTGRFVYLMNQPDLLQMTGYRLNSSNGALTPLPGAPLSVNGWTLTIPGTY